MYSSPFKMDPAYVCNLFFAVLFPCVFTYVSPMKTRIKLLMPSVQPMQNDTYLCTAVHVGSKKEKYVVAFTPNATMHVAHHILIYGCAEPGYREWDTPKAVWDCGEMSGSHDMYRTGPTCNSASHIIYAWARDAPALVLPKGVGFKVGGSSGIRFLVLQVHYADATAFIGGKKDNSVILLSVVPGSSKTVKRRAGVFLLGTGGMIPAKQKVNMEVACRMEEKLTLYPFAFRTHTHMLGKAVTGYVIKNGKWVNIGKHNPLEPQMFYPAKKGVSIVQGDILAARCTMKNFRDMDTYVGSTGNDEMCNFYMMYYVEGDSILEGDACFSFGPPEYSWRTDPMMRKLINNKIDKDASELD
uniref:peptidylglycine monooxygenase n=1 Tax=Ixodes ricinus TaxID=34613 RepID=A0A0K8R5I7_IXORI